MIIILLFLAVCFLAYSNGANDNFKGVATLYGSETVSFKTAIWWGTGCTFLGSVCSLILAQTLLISFSGKGLVPTEFVGSEQFLLAVAVGAGATVLLATLLGIPISTTHALVGGLIGSGMTASSGAVNYSKLLDAFLLPLLISPVAALLLGISIYLIARWIRLSLGIAKEYCLCIGQEQRSVPVPLTNSVFAVDATQQELGVCIDEEAKCSQRYVGSYWGLNAQKALDALHFLSAGIVSFARGLNDTPKIAALLAVVHIIDIRWGLLAVALTMATGGLLNARKVAETMSRRITDMNHGQAISANLATGFLVIVASRLGMPVSTTHVSVGALIGIGMVSRSAQYRSIMTILFAWGCTLPCAGVIAAVTYTLAT